MKVRQANIELLRIISMMMIIILHFLMHGKILAWSPFGSVEYAVYWNVEAFVFVSVNVFVLISGFFLCTIDFRFSRLIKIWCYVLFYSLFLTLVFSFIVGGGEHSFLKSFIKAIFPITAKQYWFATSYILLLCVSPLLNIAIASLNKKQHALTIFVSLILFCIMPTFLVWARDLITKGMDYTWFIVLYLIAAYMRKYGVGSYFSIRKCLCGYALCSLLTGSVRIPLGIISSHFGHGYVLSGLFFRYNSVLVALASVFLFCAFLQIKVPSGRLQKVILQVSPLTFSIYLIHDHPLVRQWLWAYLPLQQWFTEGIGITLLGMVVTVSSIFIICCIIDRARLFLFKILKIDAGINKIAASLNRFILFSK